MRTRKGCREKGEWKASVSPHFTSWALLLLPKSFLGVYKAFSCDVIASMFEGKNNTFSLPWEIKSFFHAKLFHCFSLQHGRRENEDGNNGSNKTIPFSKRIVSLVIQTVSIFATFPLTSAPLPERKDWVYYFKCCLLIFDKSMEIEQLKSWRQKKCSFNSDIHVWVLSCLINLIFWPTLPSPSIVPGNLRKTFEDGDVGKQ